MPPIIKCPHCGAEYLPEEIFYPDSVFNKNATPIRNEGKIITIDFKDEEDTFFNLEEEFCCLYCNSSFKVNGKVEFSTELIDEENFEEEFVVNIE